MRDVAIALLAKERTTHAVSKPFVVYTSRGPLLNMNPTLGIPDL